MISSSPSLECYESLGSKGVAQGDSTQRDSKEMEAFTISKGTASIYLLFEAYPVWLAILSTFMCNYLCFVQYISESEVKSVSAVSNKISQVYLKY